MSTPAEVTLGPAAIPHLSGLIAACRAASRHGYDGSDVDWAEQVIRDLTPEVPMGKDLSGLDTHLRDMHGTLVYSISDYVAEHEEQHRRWPRGGVDPDMVGVDDTYQPHTHPKEQG